MATGSILTLLPQHPTFQKVVMYFRKFHLNTMEHQGPGSCPCIWVIWVAVECYASTKSKMKQESWASREAQVHRFKQGANITSTRRLWLLSPLLCIGKQNQSQRENSQKGQSNVVTALHCMLLAGADGSKKLKSAITAVSILFRFPSLPIFSTLLVPFFGIIWDCKHMSRAPSARTESKPKGVNTPFCQRSKPFLCANLKIQSLFPWWWLP